MTTNTSGKYYNALDALYAKFKFATFIAEDIKEVSTRFKLSSLFSRAAIDVGVITRVGRGVYKFVRIPTPPDGALVLDRANMISVVVKKKDNLPLHIPPLETGVLWDTESAIAHLKALGYKISKPVQQVIYEEV